MNKFHEIQTKLENVSPLPIDIPKLYLLGDTGNGKTTIVRSILGTGDDKFPSVQQKRTTIAITEFVLSKQLPFKATYIFKSKIQITESIREILEFAITNAYHNENKNKLNVDELIEDLHESPDQRFKLNYILSEIEFNSIANNIKENFIPLLKQKVDNLKKELNSKDNEEDEVVDLALQEMKQQFNNILDDITSFIITKVNITCEGHKLFSSENPFQHSENNKADFIKRVKTFLSNTKNSISPVIEYARIQGNLIADYLPADTQLVLIDGEGIGHDTKESSILSARHLDFFHFADVICLVEESVKPFTSGGKSVLEGVFRNGYENKFMILFSKLDGVEVPEITEPDRNRQIKEVNKGFRNVKNALLENGINVSIETSQMFYLSDMHQGKTPTDCQNEIKRLISGIESIFSKDKICFIEPEYDFEMISSYLSDSSSHFITKWRHMLDSKPWQTIKAFNRRMCWEFDEFRDMKPISDFHFEVTKELEYFIMHPNAWSCQATPALQQTSINFLKQEFSMQLLSFARHSVIQRYTRDWNVAMGFTDLGSTLKRKDIISNIFENVLPDHHKPEAIELKNEIKELLKLSLCNCIKNSNKSKEL